MAVMEMLQQLRAAGSTLFLVTHNPDYARLYRALGGSFYGRIVELGETADS